MALNNPTALSVRHCVTSSCTSPLPYITAVVAGRGRPVGRPVERTLRSEAFRTPGVASLLCVGEGERRAVSASQMLQHELKGPSRLGPP